MIEASNVSAINTNLTQVSQTSDHKNRSNSKQLKSSLRKSKQGSVQHKKGSKTKLSKAKSSGKDLLSNLSMGEQDLSNQEYASKLNTENHQFILNTGPLQSSEKIRFIRATTVDSNEQLLITADHDDEGAQDLPSDIGARNPHAQQLLKIIRSFEQPEEQ